MAESEEAEDGNGAITRLVLTDLAGTTTPNSFVKKLMNDFVQNGVSCIERASPEILKIIDKIMADNRLKTADEVVAFVNEQISKKKYNPEYLALTGLVNVDSYKSGALKGEFFDDVPPALQRWKNTGLVVCTYSNGSEESQREMFRTAPQGDIAHLVDRFFDTAQVGTKYNADSYKRISGIIQVPTPSILFLSDLEKELEPADKAGCRVKLVVRPGNEPAKTAKYQAVTSFDRL